MKAGSYLRPHVLQLPDSTSDGNRLTFTYSRDLLLSQCQLLMIVSFKTKVETNLCTRMQTWNLMHAVLVSGCFFARGSRYDRLTA